jgi:hypothetical protein
VPLRQLSGTLHIVLLQLHRRRAPAAGEVELLQRPRPRQAMAKEVSAQLQQHKQLLAVLVHDRSELGLEAQQRPQVLLLLPLVKSLPYLFLLGGSTLLPQLQSAALPRQAPRRPSAQ